MTAPEFVRYLLAERFPGRTAVTSSLRARSVAVLSMIAAADRATRVIFCHAPDLYPESVDYRDRIIRMLRLGNVRIAGEDQSEAVPDGIRHCEDIWSDVWGGGHIHTVQPLDRALAGFDCWISAVYHRPYGEDPVDRVAEEGDLVRIDPLSGWDQQTVHAYLAERGLPLHPHIELKQPRPSLDGAAAVPTYHF